PSLSTTTPYSTPFPYTTLFRSPDRCGRPRIRVEHLLRRRAAHDRWAGDDAVGRQRPGLPTKAGDGTGGDRADLEIRGGEKSGVSGWGQGEGRARESRRPCGARFPRQPQTRRQVFRVG